MVDLANDDKLRCLSLSTAAKAESSLPRVYGRTAAVSPLHKGSTASVALDAEDARGTGTEGADA
eukprot:155631-Amphidinium_carterae.1